MRLLFWGALVFAVTMALLPHPPVTLSSNDKYQHMMAFGALTILVPEFTSHVATASGIMPVRAALIAATGADPILLALPVAMAASWGFMLPSGTGPNAIAWATEHIALPRMLTAGLALDIIGVPLLIGVIWAIAMLG